MSEQLPTTAAIDQHLGLQRLEWIFERIGWGVIAVLLLCEMVGLFGQGPLARGTVDRETLRLEYPRFARCNSPTQLKIEVPAGGHARQVDLRISSRLIRDFDVQLVSPRPEHVLLAGDDLLYQFAARPLSGGYIEFDLVPQRAGTIPLTVGLDDLNVPLTTLVFP